MAGSAGSVDRKKLMANGREEENRKGKTGAKVEQKDPDTFQMSPEKRVFTIEHDCVNANVLDVVLCSAKEKIFQFGFLYLAHSP